MIDVYLAPGHGRHPVTGRIDEGAQGPNGATEQRDGDLICRAAERHLIRTYGLTVYRQPRGGPDYRDTITDIQRRDPRVAVEVHHDWIRAPRGGFGFWRTTEQNRLCREIHAAYLNSGLPIRPHMKHLPGTTSYPAIVRRTGAVLWEADRIGAVTDHQLYGRVLAHGIANHLGARPIEPEDDMAAEELAAIGLNTKKAVEEARKQTSIAEGSARLQRAFVADAVRRLRAELEMRPDPASDELWAGWIEAGTRTFEECHRRFRDEAA